MSERYDELRRKVAASSLSNDVKDVLYVIIAELEVRRT